MEYSCRVNQTAYWCGNVFEECEKITTYLDGLIPEIRSIVARYREETPRSLVNFGNVVQRARDEGEAYRARFKNHLKSKVLSKSIHPRKGSVSFMQPLGVNSEIYPDSVMLMQPE